MSSINLQGLEIKEPTPSIAPSIYESLNYTKKWRILLALGVGICLIGICTLVFYLSAESKRPHADLTLLPHLDSDPHVSPLFATEEALTEWRTAPDQQCFTNLQPECPKEYGAHTVFLLVLGGLRPDQVPELPAVRELVQCGASANSLVPSYPSYDYPNLYTIATGLYPESHGIVSDRMYDEELNANFTAGSPDSHHPGWWKGEPLWNTLTKQNAKAATYLWPGSDIPIQNMYPAYWQKDKVDFHIRIRKVVDWIQLPAEERPKLIMMYYEEPAKTAQNFGPFSPKTTAELSEISKGLDELMASLQRFGLYNCLDTIVVSDHGISASSCQNSVYVDDIIPGEVPARVFAGAVGRIQFFEDTSEETIQGITKRLQCREPSLRTLKKSQVPKRYHYTQGSRIGDLILDTKTGSRVAMETDSKCLEGDSGYDVLTRSMQGVFVGHGPSFKEGYRTDSYRNVELYNLLAHILDVEPAPNNGTKGSLLHILKRTATKDSDFSEPQKSFLQESLKPLPSRQSDGVLGKRSDKPITLPECACEEIPPVPVPEVAITSDTKPTLTAAEATTITTTTETTTTTTEPTTTTTTEQTTTTTTTTESTTTTAEPITTTSTTAEPVTTTTTEASTTAEPSTTTTTTEATDEIFEDIETTTIYESFDSEIVVDLSSAESPATTTNESTTVTESSTILVQPASTTSTNSSETTNPPSESPSSTTAATEATSSTTESIPAELVKAEALVALEDVQEITEEVVPEIAEDVEVLDENSEVTTEMSEIDAVISDIQEPEIIVENVDEMNAEKYQDAELEEIVEDVVATTETSLNIEVVSETSQDTEEVNETPQDTEIIPETSQDIEIIPEIPQDTEIITETYEDTETITEANTETLSEISQDTEVIPETSQDIEIISEIPQDTEIVTETYEDTETITEANTETLSEMSQDTEVIPETQETPEISHEILENTEVVVETQEDVETLPETPENTKIITETSVLEDIPEDVEVTTETSATGLEKAPELPEFSIPESMQAMNLVKENSESENMEYSELENLHCPWGYPRYSAPEVASDVLNILPHSSHFIGFPESLNLAVWTSFSLSTARMDEVKKSRPPVVPLGILFGFKNKKDERAVGCWVSDSRLPRSSRDQCSRTLQTDMFAAKNVSLRQLFPEEYELPDELNSEGFLLSNMAPLLRGFEDGAREDMVLAIEKWTEERGSLNVVHGPVFDYDLDGKKDDIRVIRDTVKPLIPSNYFYVVSMCNTTSVGDPSEGAMPPLGSCPLSNLKVYSFVFPNSEEEDKCLMTSAEYLQYHMTSLADVEDITSLRFFPHLSYKNYAQLRARQPLRLVPFRI